jgi:hypothetical protein
MEISNEYHQLLDEGKDGKRAPQAIGIGSS